jgi:filamentous hemagglutinin
MYTFRWSTTISLFPLSAMGAALAVASGTTQAAELPVPCIAGVCGSSATSFVTSGQATAVASGNTLNVNQTTSSAVLNWQSFNVSADGVVNFKQPDVSSVALNRIWQNDPSRIFGSLNANGRVYLINQNGILFGATAKVNVGALVASSLDITPEAIENGIAGAIETANAAPAFRQFRDSAGQALPSGAVKVEAGATIESPSGQVLMFAPEVANHGTIRTPDGQTMLAAGDRVYLAASADTSLRGLLVEVGGNGSVTNGEEANSTRTAASQIGKIAADRGNVTLAGLLVRQEGQISATTSTRANGSVRLLARALSDGAPATPINIRAESAANVGGELKIADRSGIAVTLDTAGTDETVDVNEQPRSTVQLSGKHIGIGSGAEIIATGGVIQATATATPNSPSVDRGGDGSSLVISSNAKLDVSGAKTTLAMERNVLRVELRGTQLADSPLQRDGVLRSEPVFVDVRKTGTRSDGSTWVGTPLADVSGDVSNIRRGVAERNLAGGEISLQSNGSVAVARDATLDVSGGYIEWQSGYVNTTKLLGADGRAYDISNADRDRQYVRLLDPRTTTDRRWGVTEKITYQSTSTAGQFEAGYVEGRDAGTVSLNGARIALDGNIVGNTTAGRYQRRVPTASTPFAYDVLPRAASLRLGAVERVGLEGLPDFVLPDVQFAGGFILPAGVALNDPLELDPDVMRIRPELLGKDRVGHLTIVANGTVEIGFATPLTLPTGGSMTVVAGNIDIGANVRAPSGRLSFSVRNTVTPNTGDDARNQLNVASGVTLDVAGSWVNEDRRFNPGGSTDALAMDGGSVTLAATSGKLTVASGAVIDVSGGAQRRADGTVKEGAAGSITVGVASPSILAPSDLTLDGTLRGYGLSKGGTLSVTAGSLCISDGVCALEEPDLLLTSSWFQQGGFSSISLASQLGDLRLEDGTILTLRQRNLALTSASDNAVSGTSFSSLVRETTLPDHVRLPMNLSLSAGFRASGGARGSGDLYLGERSAILADPRANISLRTDSSAFLNGTIRAPGGNISVLVDDTSSSFYRANQGIWLGTSGVLDVAGTSIFSPVVSNQIKGSVLNGGTVSITARRGFIVTQPDSVIDVSGTSALMDLGMTSTGKLRRQTVASAGGTLSFTAGESILLNGQLRGQSGAPGSVLGGTLNLELDPQLRNFSAENNTPASRFPRGDRTILITDSNSPVIVRAGTALPGAFEGVARLPLSLVEDGGFDSLSLTARNTIDRKNEGGNDTPEFAGHGRIFFDPGLTLETRARLTMNAASIGVQGGVGDALVRSSYVGIGHDTTVPYDALQLRAPTPVLGDGTFEVQANFIDLFGFPTFTGVSETLLRSVGDIRGRGLLTSVTGREYHGKLSTAGKLTLEARQIYPSTLTSFTFEVQGEEGMIDVRRASGTADPVLSAGGRLTLQASHIQSAGVLRAPLGTILLDADRIDLLDGGLLSTSANGQLIPFGVTQGGLSWAYSLSNGITRIFGPDGEPLPEQRVILDAAEVNLASGSTVDVSGGGDLFAYEFIPGTGGSTDVLKNPNLFAIVPGMNPAVAPHDPAISAGTGLMPGDSIWLGAGSGVPEGFYTLLPARYALLPGAYLVSQVSGYQDIDTGESFAHRTGGTIVAGRRGITGTTLTDSRTNGYLVRKGDDVLKDARYDLSKANDFLSDLDPNGKSTRLPRDAGTVSLLATTSLALEGVLQAAIAANGRGSTVEISAPSITVVVPGGQAAPGSLAVSAGQLSALGAQTLLIGGRRSIGENGDTLSVQASSVIIDSGVSLSSPEVLLVGRDLVRVASDATIAATGAAFTSPETLEMDAGASLLRVSTSGQIEVTRSLSGAGTGRLEMTSGSLVKAPGSITLDIGGTALTDGTFDIGSGSLGLGANRIALGDATEGFLGAVVDTNVLDSATNGRLELNAREGLVIFSGTDVTARDVSIRTPVINAASPDVVASLTAESLRLESQSDLSVALPGTARLDLSASNLELAGGVLGFSGFDTVNLNVSGVTRVTEDGALGGPAKLGLSSGLITGDAGREFTFSAADVLNLGVNPLTAEQLSAAPAELGARLSFVGQSITGSANVRANGGAIDFQATGPVGNIDLGADTKLDVSGRTVRFPGHDVSAPGGTVNLLSDFGSVNLAAGSVIDVSAGDAAGAVAGSVRIDAREGVVSLASTVAGDAARAADGGSISVKARDFDFSQLFPSFSTGGFTGDWTMWKRGPGDLVVPSGSTLRARSVKLTADGGSIRVAGTIDASTNRGGFISLAAGGNVDVSGTLDAHATDVDVRGGRIDLFANGAIRLAAPSTLNVSGTALSDPELTRGGTITLRAPRSAFLTLLDADRSNDAIRVDGQVVGARSVMLEGAQRYEVANGVISFSEVTAGAGNPLWDDATVFMANVPALSQALGILDNPLFTIRPGIELYSTGDLSLQADWNLFDWRFGPDNNVVGALTLRAGGNLNIQSALNDGFANPFEFRLPTGMRDSWSYRLSGGSDLASANPLASQLGTAAVGNVVLGPHIDGFSPIVVRTGTGTIDVAAAGDFMLPAQTSVLYTAGYAGPGIEMPPDLVAPSPNFALGGGDISIDVGRDIQSARSNQLFVEWLARVGGDFPFPVSTAWSVLPENFQQGVATLGGGNISVRAGRDIVDFSASTPSIGRQTGGTTPEESALRATAGGDLTVRAGGSIRGGQFYVDRGVGLLEAGDAITNPDGSIFGPILALGDSTMSLRARDDVRVSTALNPTLIVPNPMLTLFPSYFSTYSPRAGVSMLSAGGNLDFMLDLTDTNISQQLMFEHPSFNAFVEDAPILFSVSPPTVEAAALSGKLEAKGLLAMWPSARGNLRLLAGEDVNLGTVIMSDAALDTVLPTPTSALSNSSFIIQFQKATAQRGFYAPVPTHAADGGDPDPAIIAALTGDVRSMRADPNSSSFIPKPVQVSAGRDVENLNLQIQHFDDSNVSTIAAGRDFVYTSARDDAGTLLPNFGAVSIDGPGRLELRAGRDFDLRTSRGITSNGSLRNAALPDGGADISVTAGLSGKEPAYDAFIDAYLADGAAYDAALIAYVERITGHEPSSKSQALSTFRLFTRNVQRGLLDTVLFAEMRAGGREAAAAGPTNGNFERAFEALETMFPGSNPDLDAGEVNPHKGDIKLFFSRLYTLDGGSINLMAPGGEINVGLATPPLSFGLVKQPSELGLVVQSAGDVNALSFRDFQVNESRTFAADGGNILVWSTRGDIDAGRGAKTAISAPPPELRPDGNGGFTVVFKAALSGSGIQTLATSPGSKPGNVDLFAPRGVVNAGDAGIVAGNLTIAATAVLGANNIQVSGTTVGVPVESSGLGAQIAGASNVASAGANESVSVASDGSDRDRRSDAPLADSALGWLDVFVEGFGEDVCKANDAECLRRNQAGE